ncbi:transposase [Amphritea sp.]|uniref:transposase n=1 Tax=Amphritea sp. TaxID=1872502 RepID=UPI003562908E
MAPVIATLMYSYVGSASNYKSGHHLGAALGLVPRQHACGGKERLLGISKQGNKQIRKQHG